MRKSTFFLFLLSVLLFGTAEVIASSGSYTHTNTPIELEPASLNNSYQTAAVCFLSYGPCNNGDFGNGDDDMGVDTGNQCKNGGYEKNCPPGWHPDLNPGKDCPDDPSYKTCCEEKCPANTATSCTGAAVGDDGCGYTCKKCCVNACPSGFSNYTANNIPNGYVRDGTETCDKCGVGVVVKIKVNPCNGFSTCQYGAAPGATTCLSGTTTKYSACNSCIPALSDDRCSCGTTTCDDGCGATRTCCITCPYITGWCLGPYWVAKTAPTSWCGTHDAGVVKGAYAIYYNRTDRYSDGSSDTYREIGGCYEQKANADRAAKNPNRPAC